MSFHRLKEQFINDNSTNPHKQMTSWWTYMLLLQHQGQLHVSPHIPAVHIVTTTWTGEQHPLPLTMFIRTVWVSPIASPVPNTHIYDSENLLLIIQQQPPRDGVSMPCDTTFTTAWWWLCDWWFTHLLPGSNLCFVNLCLHLHCALPEACHLCLCILALTQVSP